MRRDPVTVFIALGANLGDARVAVLQALDALSALPETRLIARSRLYRTAPHEASGPDFINAVARIETRLDAPALLDALQAIENGAGRQRPYVNAPRTLDLDILLYGDARIDSPRLTVPHPRMQARDGIEAARVYSQGFGPDRPIANNNVPEGRERNRRVEFVILDPPQAANVKTVGAKDVAVPSSPDQSDTAPGSQPAGKRSTVPPKKK